MVQATFVKSQIICARAKEFVMLEADFPMDAYRETIYSTIMNQTRLIKTKK